MNHVQRDDEGPIVQSIQEMLKGLGFVSEAPREDPSFRSLAVDGRFGPQTESAVMAFQRSEGLLADGMLGSITMKALERAYSERTVELSSPGFDAFDGTPGRHTFVRVVANAYGDGYNRVFLRDDVAEAYRAVYDTVHAAGGLMTSSGGRRSLHTTINSTRSAVSMHYLGRAFDLFIYSGMVDPKTDPYVVAREGERLYRVYARCSKIVNPEAELPPEIEVAHAISYKGNRTQGQPVAGHLLDLTALLEKHGFERIKARPHFETGDSLHGAEWWHFQYTRGLLPQVTTYGQELLRVYSRASLEGTAPWLYRDNIYKINWA